ncbi:MAG: aminotransferase class V-fold PLP-dependent enzyme [Myxococcota bacterium]
MQSRAEGTPAMAWLGAGFVGGAGGAGTDAVAPPGEPPEGAREALREAGIGDLPAVHADAEPLPMPPPPGGADPVDADGWRRAPRPRRGCGRRGAGRARGRRVRFGAVRGQFALDPDGPSSTTAASAPRPAPSSRPSAAGSRRSRSPVASFRALPERVRAVAAEAAAALGADPADLVLVDNATSGVTAVLRSLRLQPGDVLFTTSHAYAAVRRALDHVCALTGARLVVAEVPFPVDDADQIVAAVQAALPERARLAVLDGITSVTGLVLPTAALTALCHDRGIPVLIDAAHVPGHLPVDLGATAADYWVGNLHKWSFACKGCAVLHVRRDRQEGIDPLVWSHGLDAGFTARFDFQGTRDPSPWLAASAALGFQRAHGADRIRAHNVRLRREAGAALCRRFGVRPPAPEALLGALQTLPLPFPTAGTQAEADALNAHLWRTHRTEAMFVPHAGRTWLRIACQIYNHPAEYERLADQILAYGEAVSRP